MVRTRALMQIAMLFSDQNMRNKLLNLPKTLVSLMRIPTSMFLNLSLLPSFVFVMSQSLTDDITDDT